MKLELPKDHPYIDGRECTTCNTFKPASEFKLERDKRASFGITMRSKCRVCDEHRKYKRFIKKTYDITWDDYEELLESQNYKCAICESTVSSKRTSRLFVDHDHNSETLTVRGLLCSNCNHGLGQFKDSPKLLQKAIGYLTTNREITNSVEYK